MAVNIRLPLCACRAMECYPGYGVFSMALVAVALPSLLPCPTCS